jgi:Ca2+-binding RTX toxin-like protein
MVATSNVTESGDNLVNTPTDGGMQIVGDWVKSHGTIYSTVSYTSASRAAVKAATDTIEIDPASRPTTVSGPRAPTSCNTDGVHDTRIEAGDGADALTGGGVGHNTLVGGAGDDTYYVRSAYDVVVEAAGGGDDTVVTTVDFVMGDNVSACGWAATPRSARATISTTASHGGTNSESLYGRGATTRSRPAPATTASSAATAATA